jgi:lipopolysaccharide export system protein LptA
MFFSRIRLALLGAVLLGPIQSNAQSIVDSLTSNLDIEGMETSLNPELGLATATGDVRITYGDVEIRCGRAEYNANTGEVIAREDVTVWKAGVTYKGDYLIYNTQDGELTGHLVRSSMPFETGTFFYSTDDFETETRMIDRVDGEDTFFTTHDSADPTYKLRARQLTIYPDDRVVMRKVTVFIGDTPVFYLPFVSQPLQAELGYRFTPGATSGWGAFLLNRYGVIHGDHTLATYNLDFRSARGVAVGANFRSLRHEENHRNLKGLNFYYLNDIDSAQTRAGGQRFPVGENRFRINFQHRIYLAGPEESSTWYLDFDVNRVSDVHFYEDFFFEDFRTDREPDNVISLVHSDPRFVATLMTRFSVNDFYRVGERLPELSIDFTRRPFLKSGLFHQGTFSAGFYEDTLSDIEENELRRLAGVTGAAALSLADRTRFTDLISQPVGAALTPAQVPLALNAIARLGDEPSFARIHTYQEFLYPKKLLGWLNVVPRIGFGFTHYEGIDGRLTTLNSQTRGIFHAGLDVSTKFTRSWPDYYSEALGLDGLRHVVQPYINYSFLDSNQPANFPSIDRLSPTTRPRSIDPAFFTAVDDMRSWNITRLGVRNTLQTRRDYQSQSEGGYAYANQLEDQTFAWAGLNTYVDVFISDPEFSRSVSNLYNELYWNPVPWLTVWSDTQIPLSGDVGSFTEINHGFTFMPARNLWLTVGHQFVDDHPTFPDSSLMFSRVYARLSENWGVSMNHIFEADDGTMEFQSYSITRDLSSWVASIGAMIRDNRNGLQDYGILLSLTLKDFPQLSLPLDIDPNPTGRGGGQ